MTHLVGYAAHEQAANVSQSPSTHDDAIRFLFLGVADDLLSGRTDQYRSRAHDPAGLAHCGRCTGDEVLPNDCNSSRGVIATLSMRA